MDDAKRDELRARLLEQTLPVDSLNAALPHLRRPFSAEAVRWKVQSTWPSGKGAKKGAVLVAYVDARLVVERLNAVVGGEWTADYKPTSKPDLMQCELTVLGVTRRDVGQSPKQLSKDLVSDALKRAAVQFGVAVSVYALPQSAWPLSRAGDGLKVIAAGTDRESLALTPSGHASLKVGYQEWLVSVGESHFGPVLDHGDVDWVSELPAEAPAEEEQDETAETPVAVPEALQDDEARDLRARVEQAYQELRVMDRRVLLPAAFQAELKAALGSHEQLRELLTRVQDLTADARAKAAA